MANLPADGQVHQVHGMMWGDPGQGLQDAAFFDGRQLVVDSGQGIKVLRGQSVWGLDPMLAAPNDYYSLLAVRTTFTGSENADSIQGISCQCRYTAGGVRAQCPQDQGCWIARTARQACPHGTRKMHTQVDPQRLGVQFDCPKGDCWLVCVQRAIPNFPLTQGQIARITDGRGLD